MIWVNEVTQFFFNFVRRPGAASYFAGYGQSIAKLSRISTPTYFRWLTETA